MATPDSSTTHEFGESNESFGRKSRTPLREMANTSMLSVCSRLNDPMHHSSLFLSRCTPSTPKSRIAKATDLTVINKHTIVELMEELDGEIIQIFGVEQQMQSIAMKCRSLRESIVAKSNIIHAMVRQLAVNDSKVFLPKTTQTDSPIVQTPSTSTQFNTSTPISSLQNTFRKRRLSSVSEKSDVSNITLNLEEEKLSDDLKMRFHRLPALVKGYLTRRLMKTEKVVALANTIHEINDQIEHMPLLGKETTLIDYYRRHLKRSRQEIHEIFFGYTKAQQMSLIARKRKYVLEHHYKNLLPISESSYLKYSSQENINNSGISSATKKVMPVKSNPMPKISTNSGSKAKHVYNPVKKTWEISLGSLRSDAKSQSPPKKIMTRAALRQRKAKD